MSAPNTVPATHADYQLSQLDQLEAESIHIFREVAAEFEKPVLMFSGGKDSIVMLRLAEKAFYPAKIPFPVLQVDTGLDFPEVLETRDRWVNRLGGAKKPAEAPVAKDCPFCTRSIPLKATRCPECTGELKATGV